MEVGKKEPCKDTVSEGGRPTTRARVVRKHGPWLAALPLCADACAVVRVEVSELKTWSVRPKSRQREG